MLDFFFVILWQFCSYPVVDISWIIQLSIILNSFSLMALSCSLSSGICSQSLPVYKQSTSGQKLLPEQKNESSRNHASYTSKNLFERMKSLVCLFCYWRHIMQIKSVNSLLGVICCPELTASCVSAASEMELNLGKGYGLFAAIWWLINRDP